MSARPVADLSRRYRFSSAHRLHTAALSEDENRRTFGKCNNPHGHGHNYTLEVTVRGPVDRETGMVVELAALDAVIRQRIVQRFDLRDLNLDPVFANEVSTTENLCRAAWSILTADGSGDVFGTAKLERVRIEETGNNFFEYAGK